MVKIKTINPHLPYVEMDVTPEEAKLYMKSGNYGYVTKQKTKGKE